MSSNPLRFTLPVTVGRISMHVDRSVSVTTRSTKEISDTEFAIIHQAFQRVGWFLFSETNLGEADIPGEDIDRDVKSQAQLIRARCFRLHKLREEAGEDSDYDALYRKATNWLIARLDAQIAEYD
ncbi:MAG: hypothetical protein AVDCRST_MAG68-5127 [uncultured Gemmatimonadetes bacterium]|uniref:Uncharacterized protein n=1 Tax=uncultured Gemmatimonadota bacterium TaxID=203437 RepID=A0A6J4MPF8_9BACT|nr:MAG: hypothetical protein AVDCRST_MAG68-5127 [uncultured Gemmatimonadota bacterium]